MTPQLFLMFLLAADPAPAAPDPTNNPPAHTDNNVQGRVIDAETLQPVAGAEIYVGEWKVASTDIAGRFQLRLPPGNHTLAIYGHAHETVLQSIRVPAGQILRLEYTLNGADVEEFIIEEKAPPGPPTPAVSTDLSREEVTGVAGTFGDPVRVIENLPGLNRPPGGLGGALIIRGANPADSGVYLDGVQIPLVYHFGGLTSVVNAEFLDDVTFKPGGFGAEFGRATGGIVEVQSRNLQCGKARGTAAVDPLDAEFFLCVPMGKWNVAAAARRSYIDTLIPLFTPEPEPGQSATTVSPVYFDYQLKAQNTGQKHIFEVFAFGSQDALKISTTSSAEDADFALKGGLGFHRLQLRHTFFASDDITLTSSLTPGAVLTSASVQSDDLGTEEDSGANLYTMQWRETLAYRATPWLTMRTGIDHILRYWEADFQTPLPTLARSFPNPVFDTTHSNTWTATDWDLNQAYWWELAAKPIESLTLSPGVRVAHLAFDETAHWVWEPRLAARWQAQEDLAFKTSTGIYRKLPDVFSGVIVEGFGQPNLDAERALHVTMGAEKQWDEIEVGLEGFYVRRDRLPSPTDEVDYEDGRAVPVLFKSDGQGRSLGAELLVRRRAAEDRRFSGWLAYTLSRTLRRDRTADGEIMDQFDGVDAGTPRLYDIPDQDSEYLSPFDQTHILTAVGSWRLPWKLKLGFRFQYVSGNPVTPLEQAQSVYDADGDTYRVQPGTVKRNSSRMPAFHRLDLRLDRQWAFDKWKLTAYLDVMNVYNHRPVEGFDYDYRYRSRTQLRGLPILPILGVKGEF